MFDGVSAAVMEISLELSHQGPGASSRNGSLIQADESDLGGRLARRLIEELRSMGASFISVYVVEDLEEPFY